MARQRRQVAVFAVSFVLMSRTIHKWCVYAQVVCLSNPVVYSVLMNDSDPIERQLRDAQKGIDALRDAVGVRQQAVKKARAAGWSKYRIAKVLGVNAPTVDSIVKTLERQEAQR